jgi:hypothetical protein
MSSGSLLYGLILDGKGCTRLNVEFEVVLSAAVVVSVPGGECCARLACSVACKSSQRRARRMTGTAGCSVN